MALRAVRVPLTYDEAATYLRYIPNGWLSVFNFDVATNHFLNTLLTKVSYLVGGDRELVLRMPNLVGYGMYLCFAVLILRGLTHRVIAFAGFLLLNLNPYLLDYFSLSRGYGLSLGFLMGALYFLLKFLAELPAGTTPYRPLSRALLLTCGAVLTSFTLLDVYVGVFLVGLVAFVIFNAATAASSGRSAGFRRRRSFSWLPLVAAVFTLLVLSQSIRLFEDLSEPVSISLVGLDEAELKAVEVSRIDYLGRETPVPRRAGAIVWRLDRPAHFGGLRIELPVAAADKLALIEVIVGKRVFLDGRRHDNLWKSRDAGAIRFLESLPSLSLPKSRMPAYRSIMNWGGDARYGAWLFVYTGVTLSLLAILAVLLKVLGGLAVRANLLTRDQWRPLASGALWLAAFVGSPLYVLTRESALYYGGTQGLIKDTFYSLIESSFYDRSYHAAQTQIVFGGIVVTLAAFGVVLYVSHRRKKLPGTLPGLCLLAIMVVASGAEVMQRFVLHTPYRLNRTALFYIPLYVLFATFSCQLMADLGRAGKVFVLGMLTAVLSFSTYHFAAVANLTHARDWPSDAATKAMIADLEHIVATERAPGSRVVLGVEWMFSAVAVFYANKNAADLIEVVVVPSWRGSESEFLYVEDRNRTDLNVIKRYPGARSVLARVGTMR